MTSSSAAWIFRQKQSIACANPTVAGIPCVAAERRTPDSLQDTAWPRAKQTQRAELTQRQQGDFEALLELQLVDLLGEIVAR